MDARIHRLFSSDRQGSRVAKALRQLVKNIEEGTPDMLE